ncbi:F-box/kelch-repeat protein At3g23880-like [Lycium barbarum]|uniref:F-box/kelch-repeat protein At3g23880-like n=1 Tax=Lycium barbarum TaxID=112863 RepID=UPI00293F0FDD|nr:F-box/kelch-repeat protein At3g23880-like [Lycium barbarum]
MEPEADEATNYTQIPSTSSKDSILANPNLPQELITAILVRLPVKYLLQFKCVSKDWFALISSPEFVKTHLSFSHKDSIHHRLMLKLFTPNHFLRHCSVSSLFYESVSQAFDLDYPMKGPDKSARVFIVGSVNGLICCHIAFDGFILWNPSTRKFKQVPDLVPTQMNNYRCSYGFGYDEVHDDYKVVAVFCEISKHNDDAKIYSLRSDSWRTLDDFQGGMVYHSSPKLVNGKLHWVTTVGDGRGIMSIDLVVEKCRKVEQPCFGEGNSLVTLGVLGSDLSVICNYQRNNQIIQADVWIMKEYGVKESWTKLYTIKNPIYMLCPPLCMSNEGILAVLKSTLMIYNSKDDLMRYPKVTNVDGGLAAELYIESLVCPV